MSRQSLMTTVLALAILTLAAVGAQSAGTDQAPIYGSQIMTQQERLEYRQRMRNATSTEEQAQIRAEHHQRMQARAQQMGKALPDKPLARGMGRGQGSGMGSGQGMGPGQGRGMGGTGRGMSPGGGGRGGGG